MLTDLIFIRHHCHQHQLMCWPPDRRPTLSWAIYYTIDTSGRNEAERSIPGMSESMRRIVTKLRTLLERALDFVIIQGFSNQGNLNSPGKPKDPNAERRTCTSIHTVLPSQPSQSMSVHTQDTQPERSGEMEQPLPVPNNLPQLHVISRSAPTPGHRDNKVHCNAVF